MDSDWKVCWKGLTDPDKWQVLSFVRPVPAPVKPFCRKSRNGLLNMGMRFCDLITKGSAEARGKSVELMPMAQVEDIQNAITFMQQQEEVEADRIGLWGPSSGAANVSYTAGIDPRVKCMVSVSGIGDMGRWFKAMRRYWEWKEFLK